MKNVMRESVGSKEDIATNVTQCLMACRNFFRALNFHALGCCRMFFLCRALLTAMDTFVQQNFDFTLNCMLFNSSNYLYLVATVEVSG